MRFGKGRILVERIPRAGQIFGTPGTASALIALLLFFAGPHAGLAGKQIRVGVYDLSPLSEIAHVGQNASGKTQEAGGLFPALLEAMAAKAEWDLDYLPCSRRECLEGLNAGSLDLLVAAPYAKELTRHFTYTRETVIPTWAQVYARGELSIQSWFDFNSRAVGVVRDDPYNEEVRAVIERFGIACSFVEFKSYQDVFNALQNNWVDIGVVDRFFAMSRDPGEDVVKTPIIFAPIELRFAVRKDRNEELIASLDYHLHALKRDPNSVYYLLLNRLFDKSREFRLPPWVFWGLTIGGGFVLLLVGANLLLRQRVIAKTAELSQSNEELKKEIVMRRTAESAVQESKRKFQALFEFSPDAILLQTLEGRMLDCNIAAETMTLYAKDELLQMSILDLIRGEADRVYPQVLRDQLSSEVFSSEVFLKRKRGESFPAEVKLKLIEFEGVRALLTIFRDLTQQKKMEQEILRTQKLESINTLAGGIAHDFNNILSAILGNVSLAKIYSEPGDKVSARLETAEKGVMRARDLTCQLLTFSKGGLPVKETTSIVSIIQDSCDFALRGSNVLCKPDVQEDLWPLDADIGQINQVINNIVINAKDAMPDGGIVELAAKNRVIEGAGTFPLPPGEYVLISIRDHGNGIAEEHLPKIFDPYFTTKKTGNGLGLATSHSIIRNHGGHIRVESRLGAGTTFHVYLPASKGDLVTTAQEDVATIAGKGKVLIMDDEESIREMVSDMLRHLQYEVHLAKDGSEAIAAIREARQAGEPFEAVIMDLTIPGGMGGKEVIKKVREIDPQVKAIVSSGYSNDPIMSDFQSHGFDGVVFKPYGIEKLSDVIHKVLSSQTHTNRGNTTG